LVRLGNQCKEMGSLGKLVNKPTGIRRNGIRRTGMRRNDAVPSFILVALGIDQESFVGDENVSTEADWSWTKIGELVLMLKKFLYFLNFDVIVLNYLSKFYSLQTPHWGIWDHACFSSSLEWFLCLWMSYWI